jgi:hypothetical protein
MTQRPLATRSGSLAKAPVNTVDRLLTKTREELEAAKQLLEEDETRAKRSKRKVTRDNAKRAAKLVKKTMKSFEDHQELLVEAKEKALRGSKS